jgi:Tfp pilus assembly PilM family ATPase
LTQPNFIPYLPIHRREGKPAVANTLTQIAKLLKPLGGQPDQVVAIKVHHQAVSLVEIRIVGNRIDVITLHSINLPRAVDFSNIQRSQDMIADAIRGVKEKAKLTAVDASICIPGSIAQLRIVNLPYMSLKELAKEARETEFWVENEPDLAKYETPIIEYQVLITSENDDLTRVLLVYAEENLIQPWMDLVLASHLNPVYLDPEGLALANLRHATLPLDEQRQNQVIVQINSTDCQCIAFERNKVHRVKLEISEFDLVLLEQAEEAGILEGEFWDEVAGRVANIIKQALLYLQEEQDFQPFTMVYLVSEYARCQNIIPILDKHLDLAPISLWNPLETVGFTKEVTAYAETYENPSVLASLFGVALQKLNIYDEKLPTIMSVNMLPQYKALRRNRQMGVMSVTLTRSFAAIVLLMGIWSFGITLPQFLESQRVSRDFENLKTEAERIQVQLEGATNSLKEAGRNIDRMRLIRNPSGKTYLLETLPDLMPEGAELESMNITESMKINITGFAKNDKAIFFFQNELASSGLVKSIMVNTQSDDDLIAFTLDGTLAIVE